MKIISTEKRVIKSWCENPEEGALAQARNLANLPFIFRHVALMPDTHQGYGMPIGGVITCENVIIPNAVGVDIGCGVLCMKTDCKEINTETLKGIMGHIRNSVPTGFSHHKEQQLSPDQLIDLTCGPNYTGLKENLPIFNRELQKATYQLGTLGGGNHFIEIQKGSDGFIYVMLHSGSRNVGKQVADYYNQIAVELNQKYFSSVPKEQQLAFLPINTPEGKRYRDEMDACLAFAKLNRHYMGVAIEVILNYLNISVIEQIDIHHNYATMENHFGKNVMIHRKGATSAREGQIGLIPGSQGTCSYIVKGKGNQESFMSSSHGAGRRMGRKEAQRSLNLEEEIAKMDAKGIIHGIRTAKDLDEAAGSYKDIDVVMAEQADLVEIMVKLEPLAVIKGE